MRDYGKVYTCFWGSPTIAGLSDDGRLLALYLMTCQHNTIAGVFRLPDGYIAEDMNWDRNRVSKAFRELFVKGFANRCETTKWVWICKHLDWNPPENPNQRKSAVKVALTVPDDCCWKLDFMRACGPKLQIDGPNPSPTVSEPLLNQEQEQKQEQEELLAPPPAVPPVVPGARKQGKRQSPNPLSLEVQSAVAQVYDTVPKVHPVTHEPVHRGSRPEAEKAAQARVDEGAMTVEDIPWIGRVYYHAATLEHDHPEVLRGLVKAVTSAWDYWPKAMVHVSTLFGVQKAPWRELLTIARRTRAKMAEAGLENAG